MSSFATIEFNDCKISVHHACRQDAANLLFKNQLTYKGELTKRRWERKHAEEED